MLAEREFLNSCEKLSSKLKLEIKAGSRLSRGYADLGYEEFILLNSGKLLSLFTGEISELGEEHKEFFFALPDIEELVDQIIALGAEIPACRFVERREWEIVAQKEGRKFCVTRQRLDQALVDLLLEILNLDQPNGA